MVHFAFAKASSALPLPNGSILYNVNENIDKSESATDRVTAKPKSSFFILELELCVRIIRCPEDYIDGGTISVRTDRC